MVHLPELIRDLALILTAAAAATILFKWLKQPVVLGYLLAGVLVGPHMPLFPTVKELDAVKVWAEVGVVFLLFGLGLEFSFRKLAKVGLPATVTAVVEVAFMLGFGFMAGRWLGWSKMDSLFLGGVLSISSTTIIIRALEELKLKNRGFARLVFGVLIVEDLVAILLLVLLSTVAVTQQLEGAALLETIGSLGFFLVLWFVGGIFLVPSLLKRLRGHLNEETTVILSLGLCLGMVLIATSVGFSAALGAFIMGSILAETPEAERIEHLTRPVKDLFAAVFFVSVGMLINPKILIDYASPIAVITLFTLGGKLISTSLGALVSGRSLRHSVQAGMSLAQIGEFSFIIATLGLTLKVTSEFLYPIAVAVSAITTFTTPYMIRVADPFQASIERSLPKSWNAALLRYQANFQKVSAAIEWQELLKSYGIRLVLNGVVVVAIFLLANATVLPLVESALSSFIDPGMGSDHAWIDHQRLSRLATAAVALIFSAPFVWAMAFSGSKMKALRELWEEHGSRGPLIAVEVGRLALTVGLLAILIGRVAGVWVGLSIAVVFFGAIIVLSTRRIEGFYGWLERRFITNLHARDLDSTPASRPPLAPWDAHLIMVTVEPNAPCVGKTLMDVKARETYGVTIALIERGKKRITAPSRNEILLPGDRLSVIGTDEQINRFMTMVQEDVSHRPAGEEGDYVLTRVEVDPRFVLDGVSIRESGIREKTQGLVVGVERENRRILNPDSSLPLRNGDVLWIVGDASSIRAFADHVGS